MKNRDDNLALRALVELGRTQTDLIEGLRSETTSAFSAVLREISELRAEMNDRFDTMIVALADHVATGHDQS